MTDGREFGYRSFEVGDILGQKKNSSVEKPKSKAHGAGLSLDLSLYLAEGKGPGSGAGVSPRI
jgi:hypothetical protein